MLTLSHKTFLYVTQTNKHFSHVLVERFQSHQKTVQKLTGKGTPKLYANISISLKALWSIPNQHIRKSNVILRLYFGNLRELLSDNVDDT